MSDAFEAADQPPTLPLTARESFPTDDAFAAAGASARSTPGRLYMTGELRTATGLTRTHMDYYLREGLIVPTARTESGYLLFDDRELTTLRGIIAQRQAGVSIREIRQRLGR